MNATDVKKTADEFNASAGERLLQKVHSSIINRSKIGLYYFNLQIDDTTETSLNELMKGLSEEGFKCNIKKTNNECGGTYKFLVVYWG